MMYEANDDKFVSYDILVKHRSRNRWRWRVCDSEGNSLMCGSECTRGAARYKAERALFLLLHVAASNLCNAQSSRFSG